MTINVWQAIIWLAVVSGWLVTIVLLVQAVQRWLRRAGR
jgi:hypothetical protein